MKTRVLGPTECPINAIIFQAKEEKPCPKENS